MNTILSTSAEGLTSPVRMAQKTLAPEKSNPKRRERFELIK